MNSTALFDGMAARYDAMWTTTPVGRAQRDLVWRDVEPLFEAGERILDIGCGTGEDAAHFAARGVAVRAIDASPAMVSAARARGVAAEVCRAEDVARIEETFDGAISNFGALNCVEDLSAVAESLAAVVHPGGRAAICLLGRCCVWETLHYGVRLQFGKAFRRWTGRVAAPLAAWYPTAGEVRAAFAYGFALQSWTGIGLLVPPSYVKLPGAMVPVLAACDRVLARLPLLRAMADHRLYILVRK
uniref:Methyltransferase type 11 n=1 Tax=Solibacter usitatus (strain Ellin6076) TaxID=234267 RepID=Q01S22_SOLUE